MSEVLLAAIIANQSTGPIQLGQFTLDAVVINAVANGRFNGLDWRFSHDGKDYIIHACFTHGNGIQLRFSRLSGQIPVTNNQAALDFIAGDFTVDSGIPGQSPFKSSLMTNINGGGQRAANYSAFPGRYTAGQQFTVTISI